MISAGDHRLKVYGVTPRVPAITTRHCKQHGPHVMSYGSIVRKLCLWNGPLFIWAWQWKTLLRVDGVYI